MLTKTSLVAQQSSALFNVQRIAVICHAREQNVIFRFKRGDGELLNGHPQWRL